MNYPNHTGLRASRWEPVVAVNWCRRAQLSVAGTIPRPDRIRKLAKREAASGLALRCYSITVHVKSSMSSCPMDCGLEV